MATHAFYGLESANTATHVRRPHTAPNGDGTALSMMLTGVPGLAAVLYQLEALGGNTAATVLDPTDAR